jgi:hypothetical protein
LVGIDQLCGHEPGREVGNDFAKLVVIGREEVFEESWDAVSQAP